MTAVTQPSSSEFADEIRALATPLVSGRDLDPLLERIDGARYVLIGEASHGTAEYYVWRAALSRRLIVEQGFTFIGVEGDWPDCFRVNRWVKGRDAEDRSARQALGDFERWPTWMWANEEVAAFISWLRDHNRLTGSDVGFYGLDVYSLWESLRAVLGYLSEKYPDAVDAARAAFQCFEPYDEDPQRYAWATRMVPSSCEDEVVALLREMHRRPIEVPGDPDAELDVMQNAEVVAGAERYYRTMVRADGESWNVRDIHMTDTLDRIMATYERWHASRGAPPPKAIVWAHNTHVGDALATDMVGAGMVNIGQLARERHGADGVVLLGCGGHRGTVLAADFWGAPGRRMPVPNAPPGTHEALLHDALGEPAVLVFPEQRDSPWLSARRGHRAIGVVYHPQRDGAGNWVPTVIGQRYDAFLSFDATTALHPLQLEEAQPGREHETYPWST